LLNGDDIGKGQDDPMTGGSNDKDANTKPMTNADFRKFLL